jgi:two-component system, cell cycle response regulator
MTFAAARRTSESALLWGSAALLGVFALHALVPFGGEAGREAIGRWVNAAVCLLPGLYVMLHAFRSRGERVAWLVLGAGATLWGVGNTYFLVAFWNADTVPIPSVADGLWVAFYLATYTGVVLLMRARLSGFRTSMWLDGLIGATAVASVATAIVFHEVLSSAGGSALSVATNLMYPLADVVLMGLVVLVLTCSGWRPGRAWALFAGGFAVFTVTDSIYLFQTADGTYVAGKLLDAGWPLGLLLIAYAAKAPRPASSATRVGGLALLIPPVVFAMTAVGVLTYDHFHPVTLVALVLAVVSALGVVARMSTAFLENLTMLASSRQEARTDVLTGLPNRRSLIADLSDLLEREHPTPSLLVLFDLNGFKSYNDAFGHAAGDALLTRLGRKLAIATRGLGKAYRMGGDEFCALLSIDGLSPGTVADTVAATLTERGEGFAVSSSYGYVALPFETDNAEEALRLADHRMYAHKGTGRQGEGQQATNALLTALAEKSPHLEGHVEGVSDLAITVAAALGISGADLCDLRRAAQLHDVGKVAVPEAILTKPGSLDEEEWEFIRRHTLVGEKILSAAPALAAAARLVRWSHERFDGTGYPDGLAGTEIPLGARVIAVCDAYDSIIRDRPYRAARTSADAIAELRRCAGGQFDPEVVEVFCRVLGEELSRPQLRIVA